MRWVDDFCCLLQFNLACDDEGKQTLANTIYMASNLVGAVTLGSIADVYVAIKVRVLFMQRGCLIMLLFALV